MARLPDRSAAALSASAAILIEKNILNGEEARALMFEAADTLRHGGDANRRRHLLFCQSI
jgi:hypothetical protein